MIVQIAVCKYHTKFRSGKRTLIESPVDEKKEDDEIYENEGCVIINSSVTNDASYMEIQDASYLEIQGASYIEIRGDERGVAGRGSKVEMQDIKFKKNEAYIEQTAK